MSSVWCIRFGVSFAQCLVVMQVDKTQLMDVLKEEPSFKHGSHFDAAKAALTAGAAGDTASKAATQPGENAL